MNKQRAYKRLAAVTRSLLAWNFTRIARLWAEPETPERDSRLGPLLLSTAIDAVESGMTLVEVVDRWPPTLADRLRDLLRDEPYRPE